MTNDQYFTGREGLFRRLDHVAASHEVRVVAITGIGGLGKTSLVGYWLKHRHGHHIRRVHGLFVWSFYQSRQFEKFADAILAFAADNYSWMRDSTYTEQLGPISSRLLQFFRAHSICLVLDGLEVLQGDKGTTRYGMFLDQNLSELLTGLAREQPGRSPA